MTPVRSIGMGRLGQSSLTDAIAQAASSAGVPPSLAIAVAQHESGMNPNAIGGAGEIGLFQLKPSSFPGVNISDVATNISTGVSYLAQMYSMTGNWRDALIAYNEGPTRWSEGTRYSASQSYADAILADANLTQPSAIPAPAPGGGGGGGAPPLDPNSVLALVGVGALVLWLLT